MIELEAQSVPPPPVFVLHAEPASRAPLPRQVTQPSPLDQRFYDLCRRFSLPLPGAEAQLGEIAAVTEAGLEGAAHLAALFVCVARCSAGGLPLAFGPWAGSALLIHCGALLQGWDAETAHTDFAGGSEHLSFLDTLRRGEAGVPRLLLPGPVAEVTLARLREELAGADLGCEELPGGAMRLTLKDSSVASAVVAIAGAADPRPPAMIEVIPSRLSRAVLLAQRTAERCDDSEWIDLRDIPPMDEPAGSLLATSWAALLPELPSWTRSSDGAIAGEEDLYQRWCVAAPHPLGYAAEQALRCRAGLAWRLAYIAARYPIAGWAALLTTCDTDTLEPMLRAVRDAGYNVLPPSVQHSAVEWKPEDTDSGQALRFGLAAIPGMAPSAEGLVERRARDGAFVSIFDLVRRVPGLLASPSTVQRLVFAGALDDLHERARLIAHWPAIVAWCADEQQRISDAVAPAGAHMATPEPSLEGLELPSPAQVAIWSRAMAPLAQPATAEPHGPLSIGGARLPSSLPSDPPPPGVPVLLAGVVVARRRLQHEQPALTLLELSDGHATIPVLLEVGEEDAEDVPRVGSWLALDAIPVAQGDSTLYIAAGLATPSTRRTVAVLLPRLGDRDADLDRIVQVQALLERHPGPHPVKLYLLQAGRRRLLDTGDPLTVAWSTSFRQDLEALLGPGAVELLSEE